MYDCELDLISPPLPPKREREKYVSMFMSPYYSHVLCVSFPPCDPCRIRTIVTNMFHATTTTTTVGRCKWQDCGIGLINGKHQVKWESYRFVVTIYLESYRFLVTHLLLLYACTSQKKKIETPGVTIMWGHASGKSLWNLPSSYNRRVHVLFCFVLDIYNKHISMYNINWSVVETASKTRKIIFIV